jgi:hypothetical protein
MLTAILLITIVALLYGYFKHKISSLALSYYIVTSGYPAPDNSEIEKCSKYVIRKLFHLPSGRI